MKRIEFTKKELNLMLDMWATASANNWGDGDYASEEWVAEDTQKVFDSLGEKVSELISRKEPKP